MKTQQLDLDAKLSRENIDIENLFPFENKFVKIENLEEEDIIRRICPLCGVMNDLLYIKTNSGYNQKICEKCAIKYVNWWSDKSR